MTDQVLMPGADYQAICNAVRALTGGTAALKSGDIAGALAGVQPGGGGLQVDTGEFVLDADGRFVTLAHQLGKTPGFVVIWTDGSVLGIPTDYHTMVGCVWFRGLTKLPQRLTASSTSTSNEMYITFALARNDTKRITMGAPTSESYFPSNVTADSFTAGSSSSSTYWRAGVTYKYLVSDAWWEEVSA